MSNRADSLTSRLEKAFAAGDVEALLDCYTPDAVQVHPMAPTASAGRDAIRQTEGPLFGAFSDITLRVVNTVEQGDAMVLEMAVTATNTADLPTPNGPVPATGRTVHLTMASVCRLDGDLIAEEHRYFDAMAFMAQLGLVD